MCFVRTLHFILKLFLTSPYGSRIPAHQVLRHASQICWPLLRHHIRIVLCPARKQAVTLLFPMSSWPGILLTLLCQSIAPFGWFVIALAWMLCYLESVAGCLSHVAWLLAFEQMGKMYKHTMARDEGSI